jgi:hypothetical protein
MKRTILLLAAGLLPLWGAAIFLAQFRADTIYVPQEIYIEMPRNDIEATVILTRWQVEKMCSMFKDSSNPAESLEFGTVVKNEGEKWVISSTLLTHGAHKYPLPKGDFYVVDASYVDHHGDFKSCIDYAHSYKDHHEYIVLSPK